MPTFSNTYGSCLRVAITIPANSGNAATIRSLLAAAGYSGAVSALVISGILAGSAGANGTARPAFQAATARSPKAALVASDISTHGQTIASGVDYTPQDGDAGPDLTYLISCSSSAIVACCIVYI